MRVKVCGITRIEDARLCAENNIWALGFIFYKKSKRYIDPELVLPILDQLRGEIIKMPKIVGVFVNESNGQISQIRNLLALDLVQFHGEESSDQVEEIKPHIRAIHKLPNADEFQIYSLHSSFLLLDSKLGSERGGTGLVADWNLACTLKSHHKQVILAGGIGPENIAEANRLVEPFAFDLSSSVEDAPGVKNHELLNKLFKIIGDRK